MAGRSMRELIEQGGLKRLLDQRLIKALGHPVREHILAVLNTRIASATEIGEEIGAEVSSFYHHVEELERLGCIERVETRRRRGAKEHFFRAKRSVFFDDETWAKLPPSLKGDLADCSLQMLFDDVVAALEADTLNARDDRHLSWSPGRLDELGWHEVTDLMNGTLARIAKIQDESATRLLESGEKGIPASVSILAFETSD
jgi:DNA-binding transcriptional ArsR family regulator